MNEGDKDVTATSAAYANMVSPAVYHQPRYPTKEETDQQESRYFFQNIVRDLLHARPNDPIESILAAATKLLEAHQAI